MKKERSDFGWCWGNAFSTKGEKTMKKLLFVAAFAALCTSCEKEEAKKECVLGCAEEEVCVDGDCETACETHEDCFAGHGGGWHCEKSGETSYCAIGAPAKVEGQEVPECVGEKEVCDGVDNDCDGVVDNGVKNACGKCGTVSTEVCDEKDNDCDGKTDEGLLNACGQCGELPVEVCDSVDNDCDGETDEELLNACGQCGLVPPEVCNGLDDDCVGTVPAVEVDADTDGFRVCDGDCNDSSAIVNPEATEICDGIDDNCNGAIGADEVDADGDGFMVCEKDCDDAVAAVKPDAVELCNGVDDDCDSATDEDFFVGVLCYGIGACGFGKYECAGEFDYRCSTMTNGSADMSAAEACSDNTDNDCDGSVDEGCACDEDDLMICGTTDVGVCEYALQVCQPDGTWGECEDSIEPSPEICNGVDDDCDGAVPVDEVDADADGFMVCEKDCDDAVAAVKPDAVELCNGVDDDCDGLTDEDYFVGELCLGYGVCGVGVYECAGEGAFRCSTMPGGSADMSSGEVCSDNIDNNCDGSVDEGCSCEYNAEQVVFILCGETDVGECEFGTQECQPDGVWGECVGAVSPVAEICNGMDDDCDGAVPADEADGDADGFMVCEKDCDDAVAAVKPDAVELCNGIDDDCDGDTDEDFFVGVPCYGIGACGEGKYECDGENSYRCSTMPGGSFDQSNAEVCSDNTDNDCDGSVDEDCACDSDDLKICGTSNVGVCKLGLQICGNDGLWGECVGAVSPVAEICNGMDDDCDGAVPVDEVDADADGFMVCEKDCDDAVAAVKPDAVELCNAVDDDCDGDTDEDFFVGAPCDGVGECGAGKLECAGTDAVVCSTNPGASKDESSLEVCDKKDNDCDAELDEECECDPGDQLVCGTTSIGVCQFGWRTCDEDGAWGDCLNAIEPSDEVCNGADDDCDGAVDDGVLNACGSCGDVPVEICDGADNDCDGQIDEDVLNACGECGAVPSETCNDTDDDCDGLTDEDYFVGAPCDGIGLCGAGKLECAGLDAVVCSTNPGASKDESKPEVCGDNADNDCDGSVDEGCECDPGDQKVCGSSEVGECKLGWQTCADDAEWSSCLNAVEPQPEVCNGADDDCDGQVDDGVLNACGGCGDVPVEICDGADNDCDGSVDEGVLNACGECGAVPSETCNDTDDDCDGLTDEDYFVGAPCDGVGLCGIGKLECAGTDAVVCSTMPGASKDESKPEVCGDNADNDCDGSVDEGCECDPGDQKVCGSSEVGECKLGWQKCGADGKWGDCLGSIEPKAEECNGFDDDCNGAVGAGEVDSDADGEMVCQGDCNDSDPAVNMSADEFCNGVDDNCNDATDEGFFVGVPCNGLGVCGAGVYECAGSFGYQCSTMPGASKDKSKPEVCGDNADNDCDGSVDEGCECDPGDLAVCGSSDIGVCKKGTQVCGNDGKWQACQGSVEPSPEQCNGLDDNCNVGLPSDELDEDADSFKVCENDCNDDDAAVNPVAKELCNSVDDDCDGSTDEGYFVNAPCVGVGSCGAGKLECDGLEQTICSTMPGASEDKSKPEVCGDNADNDCDSSVDEDCECDPGDQQVCGSTDVGECDLGWQECDANGQWDVCVGNVEPTDEECNGLDDDCNALVPSDESDADKDGWRVCEGDCDDTDKDINPGETELCNGDDDDCDGTVDEDCSAVSCNICCGYGLGHPVVWWGANPPNTWSADGYCGVWTGTVQQICLRGDYPVPGYTDAGWADWNCQNGTSWGGWQATGVLWCVNDLGQLVDYEVVSGQVDPAAPNPEGEIILLDGLCSE